MSWVLPSEVHPGAHIPRERCRDLVDDHVVTAFDPSADQNATSLGSAALKLGMALESLDHIRIELDRHLSRAKHPRRHVCPAHTGHRGWANACWLPASCWGVCSNRADNE